MKNKLFKPTKTHVKAAVNRKVTAAPKAKKPVTKTATKQERGFRVMTPEQQREIARKGGLAVSRDRVWMQKLGRAGGLNSHKSTNAKGK